MAVRCSQPIVGCFVLVAGLIAAAPVQAQRLSLSERVARLEQQAQQGGGQGNIALVNQINALQAQVQALQGQIEELRHQIDGLKQRSKDQYIDLDSRIGRLEGRLAGGQTPAPASAASASGGGQMPDVQLGAGAPAAAPASAAATAPSSPAVAQSPVPASPVQSASATAAAGASTQGSATQGADPAADYARAFDALKGGNYAESARRFQSFIHQYPDDALTPNAYYWLGESYYVTENYGVSLDTFSKLLSLFPNSEKARDALLKVGYCQYEMKQWDRAEATLNEVVQKYPGTTVANLAQGRLRALRLEGQH